MIENSWRFLPEQVKWISSNLSGRKSEGVFEVESDDTWNLF